MKSKLILLCVMTQLLSCCIAKSKYDLEEVRGEYFFEGLHYWSSTATAKQ